MRAEREGASEPGFPPIGRACESCTYRELTDKPLSIRCAHTEGRERVYIRGPAPKHIRQAHGFRCLRCKRLLPDAA